MIVAGPWALRKPLAVASTVYDPAGAVRLKVPSGLAATEVASELSVLYRLTVTALLAMTCPVRVPSKTTSSLVMVHVTFSPSSRVTSPPRTAGHLASPVISTKV